MILHVEVRSLTMYQHHFEVHSRYRVPKYWKQPGITNWYSLPLNPDLRLRLHFISHLLLRPRLEYWKLLGPQPITLRATHLHSMFFPGQWIRFSVVATGLGFRVSSCCLGHEDLDGDFDMIPAMILCWHAAACFPTLLVTTLGFRA